ncbi:hypothetical protein AURUGA1_01033 [Aurantimicrobium sp. MWH-Uga1]|nr:hypothetical protein AURUGA1_01033 [Aurantimicrobium sp. MWH-Uga1]
MRHTDVSSSMTWFCLNWVHLPLRRLCVKVFLPVLYGSHLSKRLTFPSHGGMESAYLSQRSNFQHADICSNMYSKTASLLHMHLFARVIPEEALQAVNVRGYFYGEIRPNRSIRLVVSAPQRPPRLHRPVGSGGVARQPIGESPSICKGDGHGIRR